MKKSIIKLLKSEIELKIEVSNQEWQEFLNIAAKELSKDLKIEGFRPGQAPMKLVEEKIGTEKILEKAAQDCTKEYYIKAILEENIEVLGQPEIVITKIAKDNPFEFKAKVAVMPEVKLPDYKKIASQVKKNKVFVQEEEVEKAVLWLQKSRAKFSQKLSPCQKEDWVEIEYSSPHLESNKVLEDTFILGEGHLIPGFEENLQGMKTGQEKEFSLVFPENNLQKDLADQKVNFKVKLKSVQKIELPEINDQFARGLGNFENVAALKKNIEERIFLEKTVAESQRVRQSIVEKISQLTETEISEVLVNQVKSQMLENLKKNISQELKITFEDYLNKIQKTEKELLDYYILAAQTRVKNSLVLREISRKENVTVTDEEIKAGADEMLKKFPYTQNIDQKELKVYTEDVIKNEKTFQILEKLSQF